MKYAIIRLCMIVSIVAVLPMVTKAQGDRIFLQVEEHGEAWYVSSVDERRYYLGQPKRALTVFQALDNSYAVNTPSEAWHTISTQGIGISNANLFAIQPNLEIVSLHHRTSNSGSREFVTIKNSGQLPQSLQGWAVTDEGQYRLEVKKDIVLQPGQTKRLYNRTATTMFDHMSDEVKLYNKTAILIDRYSFNYAGKVLLPVPFTVQAPFNHWSAPYGEACEEADIVMLSHYFHGETLSANQADTEILNIVNWERQTYGFDEDTSAEFTARTVRDYAGLSAVVSTNVSVVHIKQLLNEGKLVLAPVFGRSLNNPHYRNGGPYYHMILLIGYDGDDFITHDPGTHYGAQYRYNVDLFVSAIHDLTSPETDLANGVPRIVVVSN